MAISRLGLHNFTISEWLQTKKTRPQLANHRKTVEDYNYRQVSNIRRTLECNKIVDHSDEVGASPVGAAPTTSSFST